MACGWTGVLGVIWNSEFNSTQSNSSESDDEKVIKHQCKPSSERWAANKVLRETAKETSTRKRHQRYCKRRMAILPADEFISPLLLVSLMIGRDRPRTPPTKSLEAGASSGFSRPNKEGRLVVLQQIIFSTNNQHRFGPAKHTSKARLEKRGCDSRI